MRRAGNPVVQFEQAVVDTDVGHRKTQRFIPLPRRFPAETIEHVGEIVTPGPEPDEPDARPFERQLPHHRPTVPKRRDLEIDREAIQRRCGRVGIVPACLHDPQVADLSRQGERIETGCPDRDLAPQQAVQKRRREMHRQQRRRNETQSRIKNQGERDPEQGTNETLQP